MTERSKSFFHDVGLEVLTSLFDDQRFDDPKFVALENRPCGEAGADVQPRDASLPRLRFDMIQQGSRHATALENGTDIQHVDIAVGVQVAEPCHRAVVFRDDCITGAVASDEAGDIARS